MVDKEDIVIEIDGPAVHPVTVDARAALELAAAYLETLQKIAMDEEGTALSFKGIAITDKCARIAFAPSNHRLARLVQPMAIQEAANDDPRARRLHDALLNMPDEYTASAVIGGERIPLTALDSHAPRSAYSVTSLRAILLRVGGLDKPTAQFKSDSEERSFSIRVTNEVARELGKHLYREMDIELQATRDSVGNITAGVLDEYHMLSDEDPGEAWRVWYQVNGVAVSELDAFADAAGGTNDQ